MVQLSLRVDEDLHRRASQAAQTAGTSLNGYIARVLRVALEPHSGEPDAERIRARLVAAGLIEVAQPPAGPPITADEESRFQEALARSGGGTPGSALVAEERAGGR